MIKKLLSSGLIISALFSSSLLANDLKMDFDRETIGEVRKIKLYKNPVWASKIDFANSKKAYFSSPKSMFEFFFNKRKWEKFDAKTIEDIDNIVVTDYVTMEPINAKKAYFVYGSHNISPAGDDLPSFKTLEEAETYMKKNHGRRIFRFSEISDGLIRLLNGRI